MRLPNILFSSDASLTRWLKDYQQITRGKFRPWTSALTFPGVGKHSKWSFYAYFFLAPNFFHLLRGNRLEEWGKNGSLLFVSSSTFQTRGANSSLMEKLKPGVIFLVQDYLESRVHIFLVTLWKAEGDQLQRLGNRARWRIVMNAGSAGYSRRSKEGLCGRPTSHCSTKGKQMRPTLALQPVIKMVTP